MRIYDNSEVISSWGEFVGNDVPQHTFYGRCPFCGVEAVLGTTYKTGTESHCPECGAEHHFTMDGKWYWEKNIQGELNALKEKIHLRNRQLRSLRKELRKRS